MKHGAKIRRKPAHIGRKTNRKRRSRRKRAVVVEFKLEKSREEGGYAFNISLPSGLALREVAVDSDGVPLFRLEAASPNTPAITEEDIAVLARLAEEGKRPEFYFKRIPPWHPFHGRQYKYYSPLWLRGTSVGEILYRADWEMKCLHIGAKSNDSKSAFWAREKTSNLEGLATRFDFPEDNPPGSIIMSCKSVKVQEGESELVFPDEPQMEIKDASNSGYSKYITDIYDAVAYYDEPDFLKIREIVKLILALEWLKKKGVKLSRKWMMNCTRKPRKPSKAISIQRVPEVVNSKSQIDVQEHFQSKHLQIDDDYAITMETKVEKKTVTKRGDRLKVKHTETFSSPEAEKTLTIAGKASTVERDFNWLYKGYKPTMPIAIDPNSDRIIKPYVRSWSELFAETVPWPHTWQSPYSGDGEPAAAGGVSTRSIPTVSVPHTSAVRTKATTSSSQYQLNGQGQLEARATVYCKCCNAKLPAESIAPTGAAAGKQPSHAVFAGGNNVGEGKITRQYGYEDRTETIKFTADGKFVESQKRPSRMMEGRTYTKKTVTTAH